MSDPNPPSSPVYGLHHPEIEGYAALAELALNLRWSWSHYTDTVWQRLNPELWQRTLNPWAVLQTVSTEKLKQLLGDPGFRKQVDELGQQEKQLAKSPAWFQQNHPQSPLSCVAYFSLEYMLTEALPIYSGGLGNVAGDQLKAASDLGVPVVGVGLLYQRGYFRQVIDKDGAQQALYPYNDPGQLPITPLRLPNGEWLRLEVALPGYSVWLRTWQVQVGRVKLYLLDSNDADNFPVQRGITSELYGGGPELRLQQEKILGIGGWRLLDALGLKPEVCHLNEGHAAFAVLERAHRFMIETGQPFEVALAVTRAGNLFTTHTAVTAGFDRYSPALIKQYLGHYAQEKLGIGIEDFMALGRQNPADANEPFNMAYLAVRGSGAVNGVSRLHGEVSRNLLSPLFPRWPRAEVPIGYVTNGVHMPTWDSAAADALWTKAAGKGRWLGKPDALGGAIHNTTDAELWEIRSAGRKQLIDFIRGRLPQQLAAADHPADEVERAKGLLDPNILTLGFARRFATYKRPNLLLHDPERLLRILTNPQRPVQLIMAGKAHPADEPGQALIKQWVHYSLRPEVRAHVIFLSDHDMRLSEYMVQGADVWLNTPRRPWEACGTSGMKVLVNGGLNLSELDGWWAEAYAPQVGWPLGDGKEHQDDASSDAADAEALYHLLEQEVIPEFYTRDTQGIPTAWVARMRESMARLTPTFSANRNVLQYVEQHYLPAAAAYRGRADQKGAAGVDIVKWRHTLGPQWSTIHFGEVKVETQGDSHHFTVQLYLNDVDPKAVRVELYADNEEEPPARQELIRTGPLEGAHGGYAYSAQVDNKRPAADYTARVIPYFPNVAAPLETSQILWQR